MYDCNYYVEPMPFGADYGMYSNSGNVITTIHAMPGGYHAIATNNDDVIGRSVNEVAQKVADRFGLTCHTVIPSNS